MSDYDDDDSTSNSSLVAEGLKSIAKVAVVTALTGGTGGGLVLLYETAKLTARALGGDEAGEAVDSAVSLLEASEHCKRN